MILLKTMNGIRMAKMWKADGTLEDYGNAKHFKPKDVVVNNINELSTLLKKVEAMPDVCAIRGQYVGDELAEASDYPGYVRRALVNFRDQPLHWVMFDIDKYEYEGACEHPTAAIDQFISEHLNEFTGATYHWQLSSSAGRNPNMLKAHVWFWLSSPRSSAQMNAWGLHREIDHTVFNPVQAHYTAAPVFEDGVADPVAVRSGLECGWIDEVELEVKDIITHEYTGDFEMPDPREKPGVIGAFCRAFTVEEVMVRWLSDTFRFQFEDDTRRLTYKAGGGSEGGAFVSDDRLHVINKHATDPCKGRAVNIFDLVRVHKFGHLDVGADVLDLADIRSTPSYVAMVDWVRSLPEITAEKQEAVATWGERVAAAELYELESIASQAGSELGVVEQAVLVQALRRRFIELGASMPIENIRRMVRPRATRVLPDVNDEGRPFETLNNLCAVLENQGVVVRYNCINKEDEILIPGETYSVDNRRVASLTWIRSKCHELGMSSKYLKDYITSVADENLYNPVGIWIGSKAWDGIDRLEAFYDTVREKEGFTNKKMLMRRWLISAVAVAMSSGGLRARGVLVFQGQQYAGKTRWIDSLAPKGLELIKTGRSLNVHDKDSVKQILSCWIAELGELDSTFKKSDIAALKAFLTNDYDELRRPYAAGESVYQRRTVFAASVNEETFLHDPTGNTRFWCIPVKSINPDHGLDMQQLWAQVYGLWKSGEQHYLTNEEARMLESSNENFAVASSIAEMVTTHLDWENPDRQWLSASDVLRWLEIKNPSKWDASEAGRTIVSLNGGMKKKSNGIRKLLVPLNRKMQLGSLSDANRDVEGLENLVSDTGRNAEW